MKKYTIPEIDIKKYEKEIVTASGGGTNPGIETQPSELLKDGVSLGSIDYMLFD